MDKNKKIRETYFEYYRVKRSLEFLEKYDNRRSWQKLKEKLKTRKIHKIKEIARIAAIIAVFVVSVTYIHVVYIFKTELQPIVVAGSYSYPEVKSKKAILIFDDGGQVDLARQSGRVDNGVGKIQINNVNNQLVYTATETNAGVMKYNALTVPRGGEYQLELSDGTKVWVNAESSLRYPETFGKQREVHLSGEAYFEVAKDETRPFIVHVGNNSIEVLGTHFNISSYEQDEVYTTLVEGKVRVNHKDQFVILQPDEQSVIKAGMRDIEVKKVEAALFVSWIKGSYEFRDTELGDIAAQLSRWYDVDIRFADENLRHRRFAGVIYRDQELGFTIKIIERVANVHFVRVDNDVIYINNPK